jgi:hypothetical protein
MNKRTATMKATINEALCRMAAPETRTDYFDTKLTGFTFRTTPTGAKSFWFVYRDKALKKPVWVSLGKYSDSFKSDQARTEAIKLQGDVRRGADPAKARREAISARVSGSVPFGVAVGEYLADITGTHRAWASLKACWCARWKRGAICLAPTSLTTWRRPCCARW